MNNALIDLLFGSATLIFSVVVLFQIHKNYKTKKITSQSMLWHLCTVFGLFLVLLGHCIGGYWFSAVITVVNMIERLTIAIQIKIYSVE